MNIKHLILFDIDGTLLLSGGAGLRAMARAATELYGKPIDWEGVDPTGGLDPLIFAEAARRVGIEPTTEDHAAFRELYTRILPDELKRFPDRLRVMPGITSLLAELRRREDVLLGLVTGNYESTARLKIEAAGLPWNAFVVGAFGGDAPARPALVALARARFEARYGQTIAARNILIVGDTPKDAHCARVNGCRVLVVATGRPSLAELRTVGADRAVEDLSDPAPLFELLAAV